MKLHVKPANLTVIRHHLFIVIRVLIAVAAIRIGVGFLEVHGFFLHFGKTGEYIAGALFDYWLIGWGIESA